MSLFTMSSDQRRAANTAFGCFTLALAILVAVTRPSVREFPAIVAGLLAAASLLLILRSVMGAQSAERWKPAHLLLWCLCAAGLYVALRQVLHTVPLLFGPPEFVALSIFELSVGLVLARFARDRAVAMLFVGLLLSVVGTDLANGAPRLTLGLGQLDDGIDFTVLMLGLLVGADALLCLLSPTSYLASCAQWISSWFDRPFERRQAIGARFIAAVAVAAACGLAFIINNALWDVGLMLAFAVFGTLCKLVGANRALLLMAFYLGPLLEENIRRSLLLSRGDPLILTRWPIAAGLLALACAAVAFALYQSRTQRK